MYQTVESPAITRHFVSLGDRQVHVRIAGSGPPLVLLHQSPTSSAEMATDIEACAQYFTVVAIDMPGYGLSDPLPDEHPDISQLAAAVEAVIDALGLERVLLSGFHTGAIVAFEFARLFPERTAAAVVNGLVCIEGAELDDLLEHYNVLPEITGEGAHLPWLWARLRDQSLFFPWYRKTPDARMALDLHDGTYLHPYLMDFLRAKDGGRPGYQAAFAYPTRELAPDVTAPIYLINFEPDPLATHPERLPGFPDCVQREVFADYPELRQAALAFLRVHAPEEVDLPRASVGAFDGDLKKAIVNTDAGPVMVRHSAPGDGRAILVLHDVGSSSAAVAPLARRLAGEFAGRRQVIAVDLPGHGETGALQLPDYSADSIAILIGLVLNGFVVEEVDIVAIGASALVATALGHAMKTAVGRLILIDPWFFDDGERQQLSATFAPKLMPGDYGQHLLEAWYFARDSELYWPWNEPHQENALARTPDIEPGQVQARTVEVLKAGTSIQKMVRDLLASGFTQSFDALDGELLLCARADNGHEERTAAVARRRSGTRYERLPADMAAWPDIIAQILKRPPHIGHNSASK